MAVSRFLLLGVLGVVLVLELVRNDDLLAFQKIYLKLDTTSTETAAPTRNETILSLQPPSHVQQQEPEHYSGLAMTAAFNYKVDPQRKTKTNSSFDYVKTWYQSLHQLSSSNIKGVVLENMFNDSFRAAYSSSQVSFIDMDPHTHPCFVHTKHGTRRSINDQVYFCYEWYLNQTYGTNTTTNPYVVITDSHDVQFFRNPFQFMQTTDQLTGQHQLFVGSELFSPKGVSYLTELWRLCFRKQRPFTTVYSSGIVAGHVTVVRKFLRSMNQLFEKTPTNWNCNMAVVERVVVEEWKEKVVTGYPFHTKFKFLEGANETLAYIKHK